MKKGDDRRRGILEAAERLFYAKGYEATSIQDILDELGLSKGGFYHHFESKMALLEEICGIRSEQMRDTMAVEVARHRGDALAQLNALFSKGSLIQGESVNFLDLLLRTAYGSDGVVLREKMKRMAIDGALPILREIIGDGVEQRVFFTKHIDQIGGVLLRLFCDLTDDLAGMLARRDADYMAMLSDLEVYRHAIEALLNAPYGSVRMYDLTDLQRIIGELNEQDRLAAR